MQFRIGQRVRLIRSRTGRVVGECGEILGFGKNERGEQAAYVKFDSYRTNFPGGDGLPAGSGAPPLTWIEPIDDSPEAGSWDDEVWKQLGWSGPRRVSV